MNKPLLTALVGLSTLGISAASLPAAAATSDNLLPPAATAGWFDSVTENVKNMFSPDRDSSLQEDGNMQDSKIGRKRGQSNESENAKLTQKRRGHRPRGPVGTITAISGDTITMQTLKGHTLTITVTSETTFLKAVKDSEKHLEKQTIGDLAIGEVIGIKPVARSGMGIRPTQGDRSPEERPTELTALRIVELPGLPPKNKDK